MALVVHFSFLLSLQNLQKTSRILFPRFSGLTQYIPVLLDRHLPSQGPGKCYWSIFPPKQQWNTHLSLGKGFTLQASSRNLTTSTCPTGKAALWVHVLLDIHFCTDKSRYAHRQKGCSKASWQTDSKCCMRRQYLLQLPHAGLSVSHSLFAPYPFLTEQTLKTKENKSLQRQVLRDFKHITSMEWHHSATRGWKQYQEHILSLLIMEGALAFKFSALTFFLFFCCYK